MKFLRSYAIILIIFIILSTTCYAIMQEDEGGAGKDEYDPSTDPNSDPAALNDAIANDNPNIAWEKVDQSKVDPENTHKIPPEHVKVNDVQDQSELTFEQISYNDNYNEIEDKSKLDPIVRDRYLSEQNSKIVESSLSDGAIGISTDYGFTFRKFDSLRVDRTFFTNGIGFELNGDTMTIEHADTVIINNQDIITDTNNFQISPESFKIQDAETVRIKTDAGFGDIYIENVTDSTFRNGNVLEITADDNINYTLEDYQGNIVRLEAESGGKLTISKDSLIPKYFLENSKISDQDEFLKTNTSAIATLDAGSGFLCIEFNENSLYKNTVYDFLIFEPDVNYNLCFRKKPEQNFFLDENCTHCGLIDFVTQNSTLKGRIQFKRIIDHYELTVFDNFMVKTNFQGLTDIKSVYLDKVHGKPIYSFTRPNNFLVIKEENNERYLSKAALLNGPKIYFLIGNYTVIPDSNIPIQIKDNILNQTNLLTGHSIVVYPKDYMPIEDFLDEKKRTGDVVFDAITGAVVGKTFAQEEKLRFSWIAVLVLSVL
ncbi:MAG: hypothetical protein ACFFEW_18600, partial [Candidatus Thorarchaeota archaeon]